jgi:ParB/RepB/Spo0J family partition protein
MNAPLPPDYMTPHEIEWIPVGSIAPSETAMQQLRRARITEASLAELAGSIKADGIYLPLIIRPLEALRGLAKFELVAGERRWRAAELAGLEHVPAIVRSLGDQQVIRAQLTENIQRETLSALEEAEGYRELMAAEKLTVEAMMPIVNKSRSWIYDRLKLLDLLPAGRQALLEGKLEPYLALPVARAKTGKLQQKALSIALRPGMTVRELKSHLTGPGFTANLVGAPFPFEDAELYPDAGPCSTCPKRIGNCTEFDPAEDDPNVCTDPECFEVKVYRQAEGERPAHPHRRRRARDRPEKRHPGRARRPG